MKINNLIAVLVVLGVGSAYAVADNEEVSDEFSGPSGAIISKYLQATQADVPKSSSMEVDIDASVPGLNEHGTLQALRKISNVGKITYRVLGFQGDKTIKSQVIGRYLQAEQQGQGDANLQVSPTNYKFKFKGRKVDNAGNDRYVFLLSPRKKRVGLFKGELWLDARTYLPVVEKGRLVKNPSVFFRKVEFERDFAIRNGTAVPAHLNSTIDTRLVGRVSLSINYLAAPAETLSDEGLADSFAQSSAMNLP